MHTFRLLVWLLAWHRNCLHAAHQEEFARIKKLNYHYPTDIIINSSFCSYQSSISSSSSWTLFWTQFCSLGDLQPRSFFDCYDSPLISLIWGSCRERGPLIYLWPIWTFLLYLPNNQWMTRRRGRSPHFATQFYLKLLAKGTPQHNLFLLLLLLFNPFQFICELFGLCVTINMFTWIGSQ